MRSIAVASAVICAVALSAMPMIGHAAGSQCGEKGNATRHDRFRIFDATLYEHKPDMAQYGIEPIIVHYGEMWGAEPRDLSRIPSKEAVKRIASKEPNGVEFVVLDVEVWPIKGTTETVQASVSKLSELLARFAKYEGPRKIGLYGILPTRDYWRALRGPGSSEYKEWQAENNQLKALERDIGALFPSLYTFYDDPENWRRYALAQICEARRLSRKPVYVFLWPEYHVSNLRLRGKNLPGAFWRMELETARSAADGVVIWGGYDTALRHQERWDDRAEWWEETKSFALSQRTR